ncbi:hypothetical protein MMC13_006036 [Lambiella insularis]|nr:hypothetical protein [Lambiella insularis]
MEVLSNSSSSKVKVEYTDPTGIYALVASDLNSRLPLRNLHWNSSSRPLRSIDSLYVELVPDENNVSPPQSRVPSSAGLTGAQDVPLPTRKSTDNRRGSEPFVSKKERRHQIPGLRQTPYVKIYFLRCDDSETYKTSSRRLLREWVKAHTPPSQSSTSVNNQENHDAFEYLIVHVALPDVQSNAVWPSRNSLNILDKVRADFNSSSKASVDRVAQILASRSPISSGPARDQFLRESNRAWEDLLSKVRGLILSSFDLRVRQYEEDIKAKSAQRNLPGWNFCTFFVLKEGLARGFESVGLVEDALISYDELSMELYTTVEEERRKIRAGDEATLFRGYTPELLAEAEAAIDDAQGALPDQPGRNVLDISLLSAERKPYRELILANDISAFDFECYVFARQSALLSRIARLLPPAGGTTGFLEQEDMMAFAEKGRRAVRFITSAGNSIREDLHSSMKCQRVTDEATLTLRFDVIENIVASWTFSSCQQLLSEIAPVQFTHQLQLMSQDLLAAGTSFEQDTGKQSMLKTTPDPLPGPPKRSTSLLGRPPSTTASPSYDSFTEDIGHSKKPLPQNEAFSGLHMLAAQRAELLVIARRSLCSLGRRQGWNISWPGITRPLPDQNSEDMDEVSLDDNPNPQANKLGIDDPISNRQISTIRGVRNKTLKTALSSRDRFISAYEDITAEACELYKLSEDHRSIEAMTADLALVRYEVEDYGTAVAILYQLAPFYAQNDWTDLETYILEACAQCLQKLDRRDEYIKVIMKILASIVRRSSHGFSPTGSETPFWNRAVQAGDNISAKKYLNDLLTAAEKEGGPVLASMKDYFADIRLDPGIRHFEVKDGFEVSLSLQYMLPAPLRVQTIKARLVSAIDGQSRDIWLSRNEPMEIKIGKTAAFLVSNTMIPGWYLLESVTMKVDNIIFTHKLLPAEHNNLLGSPRVSTSSDGIDAFGSRILVWPRYRSLETRVSLYSDVHLEETRSITCEILSGRNNISSGQLLIRAASAGLRLHTASAELSGGGSMISDQSQPGVVCFRQLSEHSVIKIKIPYRLDSEVKEISLKTETTYTTSDGCFVYGDYHALPVLLPLGVNVHDIFKHHALFSKFSISTSTPAPLRLLNCHLEGTKDFVTSSPGKPATNLSIFAKQPVSMVYRITRGERAGQNMDLIQSRLSMVIRFVCLDEEVLATVTDAFESSVKKSAFAQFSRVLLHMLSTALRAQLSHQDLDRVGLLREFTIGTFDEVHWRQILVALPQKKRQELASWLLEWHKNHSVIQLPGNLNTLPVRSITIPVDVPQTQIVHTARLRFLPPPSKERNQDNAIAVGDVVPAELILKYTRKWDTQRPGSDDGRDMTEFSYELDASSDTWLLGGRRRAQFVAKEHEVLTFPILLIPQRPGHLMYPSIDIKHVEEDAVNTPIARSPQFGGLDARLSCEVEYRNHGESVLVVPNLSSTTVSLDGEAGNRGGAWLVGAQSRQHVAS